MHFDFLVSISVNPKLSGECKMSNLTRQVWGGPVRVCVVPCAERVVRCW